MQILIRNLDRKVTQSEILELLRKYGKVSTFDLVMDAKTGQSKGFGFAEMPDPEEAAKAVSELNGRKLGASVMRVKRAANSSIMKKRG